MLTFDYSPKWNILLASCSIPRLVFVECPYHFSTLIILKPSPKEHQSFPGGTNVNNLPVNSGDIGHLGSIPVPGRSGEGNGDPL